MGDEFLATAAAETLQAAMASAPASEAVSLPSTTRQESEGAATATPTAAMAKSPTVTPTASLSVTSRPTASLTPEPSATGKPTQTARPTRTPTITPTAYAPNAAIAILQPGPQSRIMSPLRVQAYVRPGSDRRVRIELFGEDGRLLVRKLLTTGEEAETIYVDEQLDFEIPGVAESARLQISTYDLYGRMTSMATQDMVLLTIGEPDITLPGLLDEAILVRQPRTNQFIQGGTLLVSGLIAPFNDQPLLIELIDRQGKVVGYRQAIVTIDPAGGYTPFSVEIPYQVSRATYALVTVKVYSNTRISGMIYLISREILISP